jgi:hypothetical protein
MQACFSGYAHVSRTISLKKQKSASNYKMMNSNRKFEASMMNTSSRRSKWIYGTYDLKLK